MSSFIFPAHVDIDRTNDENDEHDADEEDEEESGKHGEIQKVR